MAIQAGETKAAGGFEKVKQNSNATCNNTLLYLQISAGKMDRCQEALQAGKPSWQRAKPFVKRSKILHFWQDFIRSQFISYCTYDGKTTLKKLTRITPALLGTTSRRKDHLLFGASIRLYLVRTWCLYRCRWFLADKSDDDAVVYGRRIIIIINNN